MDMNCENAANYGASTAAGYAFFKYAPRPLFNFYRNFAQNNVNAQDNDVYLKAGQKLYNDSDYLQEISKIRQIDESNYQNIIENYEQRFKNSPKYRIYGNPVYKFFFGDKLKKYKTGIKDTSEGKNAFCALGKNGKKSIISVNLHKNAQTIFHEFGHAVNAASNDYKTILQNARKLRLMVPSIFFASLVTQRKDNPVTKQDKAINTLKDNCGIIAAACSVPTVVEEGLASINGAKLAKNVLDEKMYKNLNKYNLKAWSTYVVSTALMGLGVQIGVTIKDKLNQKKPVTQIVDKLK